MRNLIAMICVGLLSGVLTLNAQDVPKPPPSANAPAGMMGMTPERGMQMAVENLRLSDPKKFEELQKLRQENPDEFKKQMAEVTEKMREKAQKEREEFKALVDKYLQTKSDVDKAAVKGKIEEMMTKRIEMQKRGIEEAEKNLAQRKAALADEEKNMQSKLEERLSQILANAEGKKTEPAK